jgi:hypothetical protein
MKLRGMIRWIPAILLLINACASPAPAFIGAMRTDVVVDGTRIAVWQDDLQAQAIRLDYATRREQIAGVTKLLIAMERATGCLPRENSVIGDTGVLTAQLICPTGMAT